MLLFFSSVPASAETKEKFFPFDEVHVQKDLESIDGFSYLQYPYDPTGFYSPQIFNVVEFAYSYRANMQNNYALYIYFYNPQALDIDAMSNQNKIVMAVDYDKYPSRRTARRRVTKHSISLSAPVLRAIMKIFSINSVSWITKAPTEKRYSSA